MPKGDWRHVVRMTGLPFQASEGDVRPPTLRPEGGNGDVRG